MNELKPTDLSATPGERKKLRAAKITLKEIHRHSIAELMDVLETSKLRAMELSALSEFQSLPSVGIRFAHDLISMGYFSLKQLKGKNGAKLTDQYEAQQGVWADPCVEDQFRLVVHYASHPDSHRKWWDFTAERKSFRLKHGYPTSRPTKPWYELPRFQAKNLLKAKRDTTRGDLHQRLKKSVSFMKKNLSKPVALADLAKASYLSSYHYLRCFRNVYSKTPFQYLTYLRLKHACRLLRETDLEVNAVGLQCGFENDSSFIRVFKKEFRATPMLYRKQHQLQVQDY